MSNCSHTPGPWKYEGAMNSRTIAIGPQQLFEYNGKFTPVPMQYNQAVALIEARTLPAEKIDEVAEANARLIAAAPALLEALEKIAKINADYTVTSNQTYKDMWKQQREIARAAIAQAKGEKE